MNHRLFATAAFLLAIAALPLQAAPTLGEASFYRYPNRVLVQLDLPAGVQHRIFTLSGPDRLVIDLDGISPAGIADRLSGAVSPNDPEVASVRVGRYNAGTTRIVFDMRTAAPQTVSSLQRLDDGRQRLALQWTSAHAGETVATSARPAARTSAALLPAGSASTAMSSDWRMSLTPQMLYASYRNSPNRERLVTGGLHFDAQYGDRGGFGIGASNSTLRYSNGAPALGQKGVHLNGRLHFTPHNLAGRLTVRADYHHLDNDDSTNETNNVRVAATSVGFLSQDRLRYADIGLASSRYGESFVGNGSLHLRQWTPTIGGMLNGGSDWLQVRLYDVSSSNAARTQNYSRTDALEVKWTHFQPQQQYYPEQWTLGALLGKRMNGVDTDTGVVYNLADVQTGSLFASGQWKMANDSRLILSIGDEHYETLSAGTRTRYAAAYWHAAYRLQW